MSGNDDERQPSNWKQLHANSAEKALSHPLVTETVDELLSNLSTDRSSLVYYGVMKVAMVAASVTLAQARGIDPDTLRLTPEESNRALRERAERLAQRGLPVIVVEQPDEP